MADSKYTLDEVRFDVRSKDGTDVYVYISCPDMTIVEGWHHKRYPATMSTSQIHALIMTTQDNDPLLWPRKAPPDEVKSAAGQLAQAVLTWDMGLDPMEKGWAYFEALRMMAENVVGERDRKRH
jgi:hypothetical protein